MTKAVDLYPATRNPGQVGARVQWPPDATKLAVSLWATTPSAADVAEAVNRRFGMQLTRRSVISKMHRMGLSYRGPALPEMLPSGTKGQPRPKREPAVAKPKPVQSPKPVPVMVARAALRPSGLPESRRVAIQDLRHGMCRFIAGDPKVDSSCCGHPTELGSAWCPGHARLCTTVYQPRAGAGFVPFRRAA